MPKKLEFDYVKQKFEERGYTLISTEYINNKTKLDYVCSNGHKHSILWKDFIRGHGCSHCTNQAKPDFNYIKTEFEKVNYILISDDYINSKTHLKYICDKGHKHQVTWGHFKKGVGCPYCKKCIKYDFDEIKKVFKDKGFELISKQYKNAHGKLKYKCNKCNNINETKWNYIQQGYGCKTCFTMNNTGPNNPRYKGNVVKLNIPLYETYAHKLEKYEDLYLIKQNNLELLGVKCLYCNKTFIPSLINVKHRVDSINGRCNAENRFYCSTDCKKACPIFGQVKYPKNFKLSTAREVQPALRKMVLERDNWTCQICNSTENGLHCHHYDGIYINPVESADMDNCTTLCKKCHKKVHNNEGCKFNQLKCKRRKIND